MYAGLHTMDLQEALQLMHQLPNTPSCFSGKQPRLPHGNGLTTKALFDQQMAALSTPESVSIAALANISNG